MRMLAEAKNSNPQTTHHVRGHPRTQAPNPNDSPQVGPSVCVGPAGAHLAFRL